MNYEPIKTKCQIIAIMTFIGFVLANVLFANQEEQPNRYPTKDIISTDTITTGEEEKGTDNKGLQSGNLSAQGSKQSSGYKVPAITTVRGKNKGVKVLDKKLIQHTIIHKGFATGDYRQERVQYAFDIGGWNLVLLNECENAQWTIDRKGDAGLAYGMCQIQLHRHKDIDKKRFITDWKYQLDMCWKKREGGTLFFGPDRVIKGQKCYAYVKDRFIIKYK